MRTEVEENSINNSAEADDLLIALAKNVFIVHLYVFRDMLSVVKLLSKTTQDLEISIGQTVYTCEKHQDGLTVPQVYNLAEKVSNV